MVQLQLIALVVVGAVAMLWAISSVRGHKKRLQKAFDGRQSLSVEAFKTIYFPEEAIPTAVLEGVREALKDALHIDITKLSTSDDFSQNLKFLFELDSLASMEAVVALESKFNIRIPDEDAARLHTIEDIIRYVYKRLS